MLYLSKRDIKTLMNVDDLVECIERAYEIQKMGDYQMPDRLHLHYDDNTLLYMPCVIESSFCTKLVSVFPKNKALGKPVVDGIVVLNDSLTGEVKAMIDGQMLTAIRTGAVGATAIKYLSGKDVSVLGIIGCGIQGYYQTLFACHLRDFKRIIVFDPHGYHPDFKDFEDRIEIAGSSDELVIKSDVIITASTSYEPVFRTVDIEGKTFVGIGSFKPDMREYSDEFISRVDHIFVDTPFARQETGDLKEPLERGIINEKMVRTFDCKQHFGTVFFKSVGMALFDNIVAEGIYNAAIRAGIGQELEV